MRILFLLLLCLISEIEAQEEYPRWLYELPVSEGICYAIGECGRYRDAVKQSSEARQLAAFRLAASMCTTIRFGAAEEASDAGVRQVSFVSVSIDTFQMESLFQSMTVIDSVQLADGFHILASTSQPERISSYYKDHINSKNSVPDWVKNPPVDSNYIYGLGSSWKKGLLGLEEAERMARADIAAQGALKVQTGGWEIINSIGTFNQSITRKTIEAKISNSQVIRRAVGDNGVSYVLVRMMNKE